MIFSTFLITDRTFQVDDDLLRSHLLLDLVLVQVVLFSKLKVPQELRITTLHAHVPPCGWLLDASPVVLTGLVVGCVILGLGHPVACWLQVLSEMVLNYSAMFLDNNVQISNLLTIWKRETQFGRQFRTESSGPCASFLL